MDAEEWHLIFFDVEPKWIRRPFGAVLRRAAGPENALVGARRA